MMLVLAPMRKHKVPRLRFAPVGMTELLREGRGGPVNVPHPKFRKEREI